MEKKEPVTYVLATELSPGDRVIDAAGDVKIVSSVTNGVYRGHVSVNFKGGGSAEVRRETRVQMLEKGAS